MRNRDSEGVYPSMYDELRKIQRHSVEEVLRTFWLRIKNLRVDSCMHLSVRFFARSEKYCALCIE
jgi:hypothetical protein